MGKAVTGMHTTDARAYAAALPEHACFRKARTDGRTYGRRSLVARAENVSGPIAHTRTPIDASAASFEPDFGRRPELSTGDGDQTMPSQEPMLSRGTCGFCHRPVVWGMLQNGRRRSFEPELYPAADVAEGDRFAVHLRLRRVVDLLGHPNPPARVLLTHRCLEYAKARQMRGVAAIADVIEDIFKPGRNPA